MISKISCKKRRDINKGTLDESKQSKPLKVEGFAVFVSFLKIRKTNFKMLQKLLVLAGLALVAVNAGEMLPQCQCKDMEDCKDEYIDSVVPCADHCQVRSYTVIVEYLFPIVAGN